MVIRRRLKIAGPAAAFITTTIQNWMPLFSRPTYSEVVVQTLRVSIARERLSLFGYVIMPSHIHLLLGFPLIERLSTVVRDFKRLSSRRLKPLLSPTEKAMFEGSGKFSLWKPRFDDVIVFSENQFDTKLRYIHQNPVKAGLVEKSEDYRYSSASDWLQDRSGLLPVDKGCSFLASP